MKDNMIKKMNFFDGLFLTQEEFKTEQDYHIRLRRQHNAYFHGVGIIEGLEVFDPGASGKVGVKKGAAINRIETGNAAAKMGQEIILTSDETVDIYESGIAGGYAGDVYVCLAYEDLPDKISPDKGGETEIHLLEKPKIICRNTDPTPTDPEEDTDMVVLSRININGSGEIQRKDNSVRVYAGFVGNQVTTGELTVNGPAAIDENLTVKGDLRVEGEFEKELKTKDDIITLNKGDTGATSAESGLEIFRGSSNMARLVWSENDGRWKIGIQGTLYDLVYGPSINTDLSSGNVGIGTAATPSEKLNVAGNVLIDGISIVTGDTMIGIDTNPANLTVTGNLKVEGDFEQELKTKDDIITLNKGDAGPTSNESGLEIFRGSAKPARLIWSETDGRWKIGIQGQVYNLVYGPNLDSDLSSGNVGIGTTPTASEKLSVSGKVKIDGKTQIQGDTIIGETTNPSDLTVTGDLKVGGEFEKELKTKDDIITLNQGSTGPTSELSGIEIFRGFEEPAQLLWDENDKLWKISEGESLVPIAKTNQLSTGVSKETYQNAHGLKPGWAIFFDGESRRYMPALSDNEYSVGIFIVAQVQDEHNFTLVQAGYVEDLSGLIAGEYYYVSDTDKGELTSIEPAGISNPIFIADSETSGFVLPYRPNESGRIPVSPWKEDGLGNITYSEGEVIVDGVNQPRGRFVIQQDGNVGIGVSNPTAKLEIGGYPGTDGIRFADGTLQTTAGGGTNSDFEVLQNEVIEARGTRDRLNNRLDESITEHGTLRDNVIGIEHLNDSVLNKLEDTNRIHKVPLLQQTLFNRPIEIPTGLNPMGVAFDGRHLWVANDGSNDVRKINLADNFEIDIPVGRNPSDVAFDGTHIYVTNRSDHTVIKIDIETNETVAKIPVGQRPYGMAFDGTHMWVVNSSSNDVSKINITTNAVENFSLGVTPLYAAFDGTHIWVTNHGSDDISKIDIATNSVSATIPGIQKPLALAFDGSHIWVANYKENSVSKIDITAHSVTAKVDVGALPWGIAFDGRHIWVANSDSNNVSQIDIAENQVLATIPVGLVPRSIAFDGEYLWVSNSNSNSVSKILKVI